MKNSIPVNCLHAKCPSCGADVDVIPAKGTVFIDPATPPPNNLEQAAHTYAHDWVWPVKGVLWGVQETQQNNAMYELLKETFIAGHQHALSTLPDLIKRVLKRAAENAKIIDFASSYIDHGKTGAQIFEVDKQSILDTKFDDLINLKK